MHLVCFSESFCASMILIFGYSRLILMFLSGTITFLFHEFIWLIWILKSFSHLVILLFFYTLNITYKNWACLIIIIKLNFKLQVYTPFLFFLKLLEVEVYLLVGNAWLLRVCVCAFIRIPSLLYIEQYCTWEISFFYDNIQTTSFHSIYLKQKRKWER